MKLEIKPNRWSCLATSFAMALGMTTQEFYDAAGHDGSELLWLDLPEPLCRRGFHISEAIYIAITNGFGCTPFELFPMIQHSRDPQTIHAVWYTPCGTTADNQYMNWAIFKFFVDCGRGVLEVNTQSGNKHAVAFDQGIIYDPDGREFPYSTSECERRGLFTTRLWLIKKVQHGPI